MALRVAGHDAVQGRHLGLAAAADEVLFDLADREQRIIVSADRELPLL